MFRRELSRAMRARKRKKITMEFPSLCPRPNNEKQSYWTSDYALTLLNRYYPYCDCGGQHGCEWNYAWNANAICWIFSHDSRENSLRLPDRGLRERWRSFFHVNRRRMLQCQTRDSFNFLSLGLKRPSLSLSLFLFFSLRLCWYTS